MKRDGEGYGDLEAESLELVEAAALDLVRLGFVAGEAR